jgi:hypothetical protein
MYQTFKKNIVWIGAIILLVLSLSQIKILMFNDISVEPIALEDNPEITPKIAIKRPPVYLVSYAAGSETFFKNQHALALSALNKGIDFILNYRPSLLSPEFVKRNTHILSHRNGAGYWLWKPHIILEAMRNTPENAIIVYADASNTFRGTLKPILDQMQYHDVILYSYGDYLKQIANHYALAKTKCDTDTCRNAAHIWAGFLVLRNTPTARAFIEKWLQYCEDETLITGSISLPPEDPVFTHHQHDEALLSIVHHQHPKGVIALPSEAFPFLSWHHRRPGQEYKTLLPRMKKHINGIEQQFLNSTIMINIRKALLEKYFTNHFELKAARKH